MINALVSSAGNFINRESIDWKGFSFGLCVSVLDSCSYEDLSCYWGQMMTLFTQYCQHGAGKLRNYSVFGMGLIFQKTPLHLVEESNIDSWLKLLINSMNSPFNTELSSPGCIQFTKNNTVSALGKLLRFAPNFPGLLTIEIHRNWLDCLPLYYDEIEGDKQQIILCEILEKQPQQVIQCEGDLLKIFQVFARFICLKHAEKHCEALMRAQGVVRQMQEWEMMGQASGYLSTHLSPAHQQAIQQLRGHAVRLRTSFPFRL